MGITAPKHKRKRVWLTVGTKLITVLAALLMTSVASLVWLSTRMFIEDNTALIQQMNADTAASVATQMREFFVSVTDKMRILGTLMIQEQSQPGTLGQKDQVLHEFFAKDKDFTALFIYKRNENLSPALLTSAISPEMTNLDDPTGEKTRMNLTLEKDFSLMSVFNGEVQITSVPINDAVSAIAIAVPFIQVGNGFTHSLLALVKQDRFLRSVGESDIVISFMVDHHGTLLAHPDASRVSAKENLAHLEIVKLLLEGKFNNGQTRYIDPQTKEAHLGAFRTVGFGGMGVVSEVPEAKAFEAAKRVEYRSILIAFVILCISFLTGYVFSGSITWPIKQLAEAAYRISEGDFKIELRPKGKDEVAQLSLAFNEMAKGLEERDKVKEIFNKFHNKEITNKLLSGEVKLGGERKEAVIFFSDVRGFTAMSESMQPEEVVEMLNEYMTRMVSIIHAHKGIVDKYVGDAIMAIWGVPINHEDDALQAIRACIAMRQELAALNELRISRGQNTLKIGMGVNLGQVIAGNIGSNEKMEYTVIGDSVNVASRIESMTKAYGTDLLISSSVFEKVKDQFITQTCESAKVKGKSSSLEVFKVLGLIKENGERMIVETPYSSYAAEKSDKVEKGPDKEPETNPKQEPQTESTGESQDLWLTGAEPTRTITLTIIPGTEIESDSEKSIFSSPDKKQVA